MSLISRRPRGVTYHLSRAGILAPRGTIPEWVYADGKAVHTWTEAYDLGEPLPPLVNQRQIALTTCYMRALSDGKVEVPEFHLVELDLVSFRRGYMGIVDRALPHVLDIKTGKPQPWHKLQTAGYAQLLEPEGFRHVRRYCLYLSTSEPARLIEHTDALDHVEWCRALEVSLSHDHDRRLQEAEAILGVAEEHDAEKTASAD